VGSRRDRTPPLRDTHGAMSKESTTVDQFAVAAEEVLDLTDGVTYSSVYDDNDEARAAAGRLTESRG
jgi:hypothetical protein